MQPFNKFPQKPHQRNVASAPLPAHTAFTASMVAQAQRVPRLANLQITRGATAKVGIAARGARR